jgi:hypothetical protein
MLKRIICIRAGRSKEAVKDVVKKIAFAASPGLKNFADSIALHKYLNIRQHD